MLEHSKGCGFEKNQILGDGCDKCSHVLHEYPDQLPEKFNRTLQSVGKRCPNCDSIVKSRINGLYPLGISLICECLKELADKYRKGE